MILLKMRKRTPPQKRISESTTRFNMAVWGRQSGKTTYGGDKVLIRPLQGRAEGIYWNVLQTYSAAEIAFNRYIRMIRGTSLLLKKNESERWVQLINGSKVHFKSGHNFEDLRAETLDGCVIDELRQQHPDLWPMIIRPMLARRKGWCDFLTTANGFDHCKDLWDFAESNPEWSTFHAPSTEAPWWSESEILSAKATMSDDVFAQEIMAEFREIGTGKAYKNHGLHNQCINNPFATPGYEWCHFLPLIVGLDFNVGVMAWEIGQRRGNRFHFGDEIALENTDTEQMATVLVQKILEFYAVLGNNPKPDVILVGDASGNARRTSAVGQTDYTIIKRVLAENKIVFENRTPSENPGVKDRVNCINSHLKAADGTVNLTYNPLRCKHLKRDFERVKWKMGADGAFLDKRDPMLTHSSDGAGYPVCLFSDVFRVRAGKMRVIAR